MKYVIIRSKNGNPSQVLSRDLTLIDVNSLDVCSHTKFFESLEDAILAVESNKIIKNFTAVDFEIFKGKAYSGVLKLQEVVHEHSSSDSINMIKEAYLQLEKL